MVNSAGNAALNIFKGNVTVGVFSLSYMGLNIFNAFAIVYNAVNNGVIKLNKNEVIFNSFSFDVVALTKSCSSGNNIIKFISL